MIWYDWMIIRGLFCILLSPSTWSNLSIVVQSSSQWDGGSAGQPCWRHAETQMKPNCMFLWKMHLRRMTTIWSPTGDSKNRFRKKIPANFDLTWLDLSSHPWDLWDPPFHLDLGGCQAASAERFHMLQRPRPAWCSRRSRRRSLHLALKGWIWGKPWVVFSMHLLIYIW